MAALAGAISSPPHRLVSEGWEGRRSSLDDVDRCSSLLALTLARRGGRRQIALPPNPSPPLPSFRLSEQRNVRRLGFYFASLLEYWVRFCPLLAEKSEGGKKGQPGAEEGEEGDRAGKAERGADSESGDGGERAEKTEEGEGGERGAIVSGGEAQVLTKVQIHAGLGGEVAGQLKCVFQRRRAEAKLEHWESHVKYFAFVPQDDPMLELSPPGEKMRSQPPPGEEMRSTSPSHCQMLSRLPCDHGMSARSPPDDPILGEESHGDQVLSPSPLEDEIPARSTSSRQMLARTSPSDHQPPNSPFPSMQDGTVGTSAASSLQPLNPSPCEAWQRPLRDAGVSLEELGLAEYVGPFLGAFFDPTSPRNVNASSPHATHHMSHHISSPPRLATITHHKSRTSPHHHLTHHHAPPSLIDTNPSQGFSSSHRRKPTKLFLIPIPTRTNQTFSRPAPTTTTTLPCTQERTCSNVQWRCDVSSPSLRRQAVLPYIPYIHYICVILRSPHVFL